MSKKHLVKAGIISALCLSVTGGVIACTPQEGGDPPPITYEMTTTIADTELEVGQRESVFVDVSNMENEEIVCSISDQSVVFYDAVNGKLIGLKAGSATVTFMLKNKPSVCSSITITVVQTTEYAVTIGDNEAIAVVHGNKIPKPKDLDDYQTESTIYEFDCWVKEDTDIEWDFDTPVTSNVTLVARWNTSPRYYTVKVGDREEEYTYNAVVPAPKNPSDYKTETQEFIFDGWYVKDTNVLWNFVTDKVKGDVVIEPRFTAKTRYYTITYIVDGEEYKVDKYEYNSSLVHPDSPSKESDDEFDYVFVGWKGEDNGMKVTSDTIFVAEFESRKNYTIVSGKVTDKSGKALVCQ